MRPMKTFLPGVIFLFTFFAGCQREVKNLNNTLEEWATKKPVPSSTCTNPYVITLESKTISNGQWIWIWSVKNPNPGNGLNGTAQDLSHWGMQFGNCFNWADVVATAFSSDGINWTTFTPSYQVDNSQSCVLTPVLKYGMGTSGQAKSYYKLVLSQNYSVNNTAFCYIKSGSRLPCCTATFEGVGCPQPDASCSLSQGYWFANSNHTWPDVNGASYGNVTIGGYDYTEAEGRAIAAVSNAGGLLDSKKAFMQVAAIKLSGSTVSVSASVWADVAICESWLSGLGKLSPTNLPTGNTAVKDAAGRIGDWINLNHCEEE